MKKSTWIIISVLVVSAALFGFAFYRADKWAREVNCLYIPQDQMQVNAKECQQ